MNNKQRIINCDQDPFVPFQWTLHEHVKCGVLAPAEVQVILTESQLRGQLIPAKRILKELENMLYSPLNDNALIFFINNPDCIPNHMIGKNAIFPQTRFCCQDGSMHVLRMYWQPDGRCRWEDLWLDQCLGLNDPIAAIPKFHQ